MGLTGGAVTDPMIARWIIEFTVLRGMNGGITKSEIEQMSEKEVMRYYHMIDMTKPKVE